VWTLFIFQSPMWVYACKKTMSRWKWWDLQRVKFCLATQMPASSLDEMIE
jgi:hypothetical protein